MACSCWQADCPQRLDGWGGLLAAEGPTPAMLTAAGGQQLQTWPRTRSVYVAGGMSCRCPAAAGLMALQWLA